MEKTQGIVIRTLKYGDSSLVVDVYTEVHGPVSFLVRVPKGRKANVKGVLFRPMTMLELDYEHRPKASLQKIKDVRIAYAYTSIPYHPYKAAMALFLSEFLYRVLRSEAAHPSLYSYLTYSLQWFDRCETGFSNFHILFLIRLTRFLGFYPNVEEYSEGDFFDLQNACFTPLRPFHFLYLQPEEARHLPLLMRMSYETMHRFSYTQAQRARMLVVLNDYYRIHLPDFPELKSLDVLHEVFS